MQVTIDTVPKISKKE